MSALAVALAALGCALVSLVVAWRTERQARARRLRRQLTRARLAQAESYRRAALVRRAADSCERRP